MIYIYVLSDENDNIRYVGQTNNIKRRYNYHLSSSLNENSDTFNTYKDRWIRKLLNGGIKPKIDIIEECNNLKDANFSEKFYIDYLTYLGVKLTNSHHIDVTEFSKKTKKKMSDSKKGKTLEEIFGEEKGKEIKEKFIKRTKDYFTGKEKPLLQKEKISNTLKEYFKDKNNHWAYGKNLSIEHTEKLRMSHLNNSKNIGNKKPRTEEQKEAIRRKIKGTKVKRHKILQYDKNMNLIKEWNSLREISKNDATLNRAIIAKCCKGITPFYAGYIWKYKL